MRKFLLSSAFLLCGIFGAQAYWLPSPVVTGETVEDGKVTLTWTYDNSEIDCKDFQVIVYKMHVATGNERFVLAANDFSNIESSGTFIKPEERGANWDFISECPGWWVRQPMYMNGAMGIDTFFYFTGSDNSDIFGGAYMSSPDYDLSNLTDPTVYVETSLANQATSVTGGFALYAWNTNWFDERNIDYKAVYGTDMHYSDLSSSSWKAKSEQLKFPVEADYSDPEQLEEIRGIDKTRSRVVFYGKGYSAYWIDNFTVSVNMAAGDKVDFGASIHEVEGNTFTIDTSADTPEDYVYAYEIRALQREFDDYRNLTTIRAVDHSHLSARHVIGRFSGINDIATPESAIEISARNGMILIEGAEGLNAQVFNVAGQCIYNGPAEQPVMPGRGVYIVKAGDRTAKVVL